MEENITASVGIDGKNIKADVVKVQKLLIQAGFLPAKTTDGKTNADGICGNGTKTAITNFQKQKMGIATPDGRVDPGGKTWKALNVQPQPVVDTSQLKISGEALAQIQQLFPSGITVAIYCDYDKTGKTNTDANNAEFPRAAAAYAKFFNAVGIDATGTLKLGIPMAIKSLDQVTKAIQQVHEVLKREYLKTAAAGATALPAFTKIKTLSLFSHGQPYGLNLLGRSGYNLRIDSATELAKMKQFVQGIRTPLTDDVSVGLFACHTGRETDGTETSGIWYIEDADKQDGSTSFASALAAELGKNASTFGHLSAGHTVDNYSARAFGKEAGKNPTVERGGIHIFYLLYTDSFRDAEAARLGKTREKVRAHMQKHYRARMDESSKDKLSVPNAQGQLVPGRLGALMFSDLPRARKFLQGDWATWVVANPMK
jgi:hypothetical protein